MTVERDATHKAYLEWMKSAHPKSRPVNGAELNTTIQQALGRAVFRSEPVWDGPIKRRMVLINSLNECRAAFDQSAGYAHIWA